MTIYNRDYSIMNILARLTFTIVWTNSADDRLMIFFSPSPPPIPPHPQKTGSPRPPPPPDPQKTGFDISCNLSPLETVFMKYQNLFSGTIRKYSNMCPAENFTQSDWSWCLTTCQPLWVVLCSLPEKGRDSRGDEREVQGRKRNRNESEETEEIKTSPSTLTCYKDSRPCPAVSQYQLDAPVMYDKRHLRTTQPPRTQSDKLNYLKSMARGIMHRTNKNSALLVVL